MYYARRIQELVCRQKRENDFETSILFILSEDHKKLINQFWSMSKFDGLVQLDTNNQRVFMTANIAESTLCYSWGQATNGKLGNGIRDGYCDDISGFIREDLS